MSILPSRPARQGFAIYAITKHGLAIAETLHAALPGAELLVSPRFLSQCRAPATELPLPMGARLAATFHDYDCHIFVVSVGAVVRMIAPLLQSKKTDPAVVCVDDARQFAVALLSGHVGRGNVYTERVAAILGALAVVTTASDVNGTLTVDILGRDLGWTLADPDFNVTRGCAAVVNEAPVCVVQETGEHGWWPADKALPKGVVLRHRLEDVDPAAYEILLLISDRLLERSHFAHHANAVTYRPKSLVIGVGCDRHSPIDMVERGIRQLIEKAGLAFASIGTLASIEVKRDEPCLNALAERHGWQLAFFSADELDQVTAIRNPSDIVLRHVGTRGVAEPAAMLAAGVDDLLVPKQKYKESATPHNMTLAVARRVYPLPRPAALPSINSEVRHV